MSVNEAVFHSQFFGGFNRREVAEYIAALADERNALAEENEALRDKLKNGVETDFYSSIENIFNDKESVGPPEEEDPVVARTISEVDELLKEIENRYDIICADLDVNTAHVRCEMENTAVQLENLSEMLKSIRERLGELRSELGADTEG